MLALGLEGHANWLLVGLSAIRHTLIGVIGGP